MPEASEEEWQRRLRGDCEEPRGLHSNIFRPMDFTRGLRTGPPCEDIRLMPRDYPRKEIRSRGPVKTLGRDVFECKPLCSSQSRGRLLAQTSSDALGISWCAAVRRRRPPAVASAPGPWGVFQISRSRSIASVTGCQKQKIKSQQRRTAEAAKIQNWYV